MSPSSRAIVAAFEAEYRRYQSLGEKAMAQVDGPSLVAPGASGSNSIAVIVWHMSGNFESRFTDFLSSDGEKPSRHRDEEFVDRQVTRDELVLKWRRGWTVLFDTLASLDDESLAQTVTIRSKPLSVLEALVRSLAHVSYHVGQIVYVAKAARGDDWESLSIPVGQSEQFNQRMKGT